MIEFSATDEERLVDETADKFGREQLRPLERQVESDRAYSRRTRAAYAELGLASPDDFPLALRARIWERIAAADSCAAVALAGDGREAVVVRDGPRPGGDAISVDEAWVPVSRPERLVVIFGDGVVRICPAFSVELAGVACGLRAAGAARLDVRDAAFEPIGDAAEATRLLAEYRVLAAASMLGAARDASAYARSYAQERTAFGRPIAHHQALAFDLMDAATDLDAAGLLLESACTENDPEQIAAAHALVTDTALRVVERAVQTLGGHGYLFDHPVEKRMRDIRALASLYGGASLSQRDAARAVLDLSDPLELS